MDENTETKHLLLNALEVAIQTSGLSFVVASKVIGLADRKDFSFIEQGLEPNTRTGQLAVYFILIVTALLGKLGSDDKVHHWLTTNNKAFENQTPLELMSSHDGLLQVMSYLNHS